MPNRRTRLQKIKNLLSKVASIAKTLSFLGISGYAFYLSFIVTILPLLFLSSLITASAIVSALLFKDSLSYALLNLGWNAIKLLTGEEQEITPDLSLNRFD